MIVIENKQKSPNELFLQTMMNGSNIYQNVDPDRFLQIDKNSPLTIQIDGAASLVELKYDYLLFIYDGSIPADEMYWQNPFYKTTKALFEQDGSTYVTHLPEAQLSPSSQTNLGYVYTATIAEGTKTFVYNFMVPENYFYRDDDQ